jgi:CDGSH-type Zn-finger protein
VTACVPGAPEGHGRRVSHPPPAAPEPLDDVNPGAEVGPVEDAEAGSTTGATITPYRDGPLIVRGDFRLVDQDGTEIDPGRDTIALCRCGKSGIKPFCDGTHKRSGFSAPSAPSRPRPAARILREARRTDG